MLPPRAGRGEDFCRRKENFIEDRGKGKGLNLKKIKEGPVGRKRKGDRNRELTGHFLAGEEENMVANQVGPCLVDNGVV